MKFSCIIACDYDPYMWMIVVIVNWVIEKMEKFPLIIYLLLFGNSTKLLTTFVYVMEQTTGYWSNEVPSSSQHAWKFNGNIWENLLGRRSDSGPCPSSRCDEALFAEKDQHNSNFIFRFETKIQMIFKSDIFCRVNRIT